MGLPQQTIHFRKICSRATFALQRVSLYLQQLKSYKAVKLTTENATIFALWGRTGGTTGPCYTF